MKALRDNPQRWITANKRLLFTSLKLPLATSFSCKTISAPGADIIPKWKYIRTWSADITKLGESFKKMEGIKQL